MKDRQRQKERVRQTETERDKKTEGARYRQEVAALEVPIISQRWTER